MPVFFRCFTMILPPRWFLAVARGVFLKGMSAVELVVPLAVLLGMGVVLITVKDEDKAEAIEIARGMHETGRKLVATPGTAIALVEAGIPCESVNKIQDGSPNILDLILDGKVSLMVNTPSLTENSESEAARIRRACIETGVPCVTSIDTAGALLRAIEVFSDPSQAQCLRLDEYFAADPS